MAGHSSLLKQMMKRVHEKGKSSPGLRTLPEGRRLKIAETSKADLANRSMDHGIRDRCANRPVSRASRIPHGFSSRLAPTGERRVPTMQASTKLAPFEEDRPRKRNANPQRTSRSRFRVRRKRQEQHGILVELDNSVEWGMLIHSQHLRMPGKRYKGNDGNKVKTVQSEERNAWLNTGYCNRGRTPGRDK